MNRTTALTLLVLALASSTLAQERMSMIPADKMTDAQKKAVADYKASNKIVNVTQGNKLVAKQIEDINQQIALARSRKAEAQGRLDRVKEASRGPDSTSGLVEVLQSPRQREVFDRLIALSTLLEGHADHVMDAVGPAVVPSVATIRARFTARRRGGGMLDRILRTLLGVDAKVKQYAAGAAFTRYVVDEVGMAGFNRVWESPETVPLRAEIADPAAWVRRIRGR